MPSFFVDQNNLQQHLQSLIELNDAFLDFLGVHTDRSENEKQYIIEQMVLQNPHTHFIGISDKEEQLAGFCYFNCGTGYSAGGKYIWINSIYIDPQHQKKGLGKATLQFIAKWARINGFKKIFSSRNNDNLVSEKLFNALGYEQSENTWVSKSI